MEFMDIIKGRRSIRKFTSEPVPKEKLEYCMDAALWAPSAQNLQPWLFVVLRKDEDIKFLIDTLGTTAFSERKKLERRFKNNPEIIEETMEFERAMGGSHCIVLAFLRKKYAEDLMPSCIESVAAAMQNFVLASLRAGDGHVLGGGRPPRGEGAGRPLRARKRRLGRRYHRGLSEHGAASYQAQGRTC